MLEPLLSVRDLAVEFRTDTGFVRVVDGMSFDIHAGETLGIVGESGSGKSVTVQSLLGLLPRATSRVAGGTAIFLGRNLLSLPAAELRRIKGRDIAMVFQGPMSSLNPVFTIGYQVAEAIREHQRGVSADEVRQKTLELLAQVGLPNPELSFRSFPFQYSGGMRQRAMIAMAIANSPRLLIADEPTTALDVTIQAQVMQVLRDRRGKGSTMLLITHDIGLVAEATDRVVVMYAGRAVETGATQAILSNSRHPYTRGLLASLPRLDADIERLNPIAGTPPNISALPSGCAFHPRCSLYRRLGSAVCTTDVPALTSFADGRQSACHFSDALAAEAGRPQ